jgi:hypothetical protein
MNTHPRLFNSTHFSSEKFPEIIAFCDRVEKSHVRSGISESYTYELNGKQIYTLKKLAHQWELEESENNMIIRVSTGRNLGLVLMQGLRFSDADKGKEDDRISVIFPVQKTSIEKALALMYYYGGYPGNFLLMTPELAFIIDRYIDPDITFLSFSYVPIRYLEWLRDQLKNAGIIEAGAKRTLWAYKK